MFYFEPINLRDQDYSLTVLSAGFVFIDLDGYSKHGLVF